MIIEKQKAILECMADVLGQNGFRSEVLGDGSAAQPLLLRAETQRMGKVGKEVMLECCFVPIALPNEDTGLLQFYVTLFQNVPEMYHMATRQLVNYVNNYTALGSFALYAEGEQVFLKHNTLLDASVDFEKIITFFADNISVLVASVTKFIDAFGAVCFTGLSLESAIDQELVPSFGGAPMAEEEA